MRTSACNILMKNGIGNCRTAVLRVFMLIPLSLTVLFPVEARAEEPETVIRARHLEYNTNQKHYHLEGDVRIERSKAVLEAETVDFFEATGEARASGIVRYEDDDAVIETNQATINVNAKTGSIRNATLFFKKDNYHIWAKEIERIDEDRYMVNDASFTTCDGLLPSWCFTTSEADIRVGDRIKAKNVFFRIQGVPVLYSPIVYVPHQTERKTGFLIPEVGFRSDKGFQWRQPFYLAIAENRDATFYVDYYTRRGVGGAAEYRYAERGFGTGEWWFYYLRDRKLKTDFVEVKGRHAHFRRHSLSGFLDVNLINEKTFFQEYSLRVERRASRFLESTGELFSPLRNGRIYIQGRYWQELRSGKTTGDIAQKMPEIAYIRYPEKVGPFYVSLNTSYSYFHSENLHRVHRFDAFPTLFHSFGDAVQISQTLGLRETLYAIGNTDEFSDSVSRESLNYSIDLHTRLKKRYTRLTHVVEPTVGYAFISDADEDLPLLDRTELFTRVSRIEAGARNYLLDSGGQLLSVKLTGSYDFHEGDRPFGLINLETALFRPFSFKLDTSFNPHSAEIEKIDYSAYLKILQALVSLGQRYTRDEDILFYTGGAMFPLSKKLSLTSRLWYDAKGEGLRYLTVGADYSAQCWRINVEYITRPDDYSIFFIIELKGLGAIKMRSV